jgi:hypothetical protein
LAGIWSQTNQSYASSKPVYTALTCLTDRWSIIALALLLFNDHFLKYAWPSWLTGKLSDFAGLYFAPFFFLTITFFALWLIESASHRDSEQSWLARHANLIAIIWFIMIGGLFTALKISPASSQIVLNLMESFTGLPQAATVDPTDLLALAVLPIAFWQWHDLFGRQVEVSSHPREFPRNLKRIGQLSVLGVASVAIVATSYVPGVSVVDLAPDARDQNILYATLGQDISAYQVNTAYALAKSSDKGATWVSLGPGGRRIVTDPKIPGLCYLNSGWNVWAFDANTRQTRGTWPAGQVGVIEPNTTSFESGPLPAIAAPDWPLSVVFAVAQNQVVRSYDSGSTWETLPIDLAGSNQAQALACAPSQPGLIFLITSSGKDTYTLLRSEDYGTNWREIGVLPEGESKMVLAVHPSNPNLLIIGGLVAMHRSTDAGAHWEKTYVPPLRIGEYRTIQDPLNAASILFDSRYPGTVYVSGGYRLLKSNDDGYRWKPQTVNAYGGIAQTISPDHIYIARGPSGIAIQNSVLRWPWQNEWETILSIPGLKQISFNVPFMLMSIIAMAVVVLILFGILMALGYGLRRRSLRLELSKANAATIACSIVIIALTGWCCTSSLPDQQSVALAIASLAGIMIAALVRKPDLNRFVIIFTWIALAVMLFGSWSFGAITWPIFGIAVPAVVIGILMLTKKVSSPKLSRLALLFTILAVSFPGWVLALLLMAQ